MDGGLLEEHTDSFLPTSARIDPGGPGSTCQALRTNLGRRSDETF
jgi:hypothetical protein